jgi:hypothetical protein
MRSLSLSMEEHFSGYTPGGLVGKYERDDPLSRDFLDLQLVRSRWQAAGQSKKHA